jgi:AraC family transcriptional regulator of adaptative response / DNA-3-methyladenine glycosylase II
VSFVRLPHHPALAAHELIAFLARRAVAGVEAVQDGTYRRSLRLRHGAAILALTPHRDHVHCELRLDDPRDEAEALAAARRSLRLDAEPDAIAARLGADPVIGPSVRAAPGRRIPGHHDPAELAVRAVLGQQVSVEAAATLAARLVAAHGERLARPSGGVTHLFPTTLATLRPEDLPMPRARGRALVAIADAPAKDPAGLFAVAGVGPWTASYVALRAFADDDAFLPTDLGVRRGLEALGQDPREALSIAEAWRPYRAFAMAHVWAAAGAATPPRSRPSPRARGSARAGRRR